MLHANIATRRQREGWLGPLADAGKREKGGDGCCAALHHQPNVIIFSVSATFEVLTPHRAAGAFLSARVRVYFRRPIPSQIN